MKLLVSGLCGFMGKEVAALAMDGYRGAELAAGVDSAADGSESVPCAKTFTDAQTNVDCIVDFSHHSCTKELLAFAVTNRLPLVLATTGQTEEEKAAIVQAAKEIPLFFAANYSLGVALLIELAVQTAKAMPEAEIEIIEQHHDRKIDAPSGTALAIAEAIGQVRNAPVVSGRTGHGKRSENEIGIHSVRMGNIVGVHEVLIGTKNQTITLKHEAHSRALFAEGALAAAAFLCGKSAGLYDMKSMIGE
jgi:4-hydroxy-tetrahydrodipicolinate reductase